MNLRTYLRSLYHARQPLYTLKLNTNICNQITKNRHFHISFDNVLNDHKCGATSKNISLDKNEVYVKLNKLKMQVNCLFEEICL